MQTSRSKPFIRLRRAAAGALVCCACAAHAQAATLLVPQQYATIQAAVNAAANGDEVVVANGTYTGAGNVDVDFLGLAITIRSANGAASCVIDCQQSARAFHLHSGESATSVIQGFTVRNGDGGTDGGAVFCDGTSALILDCVFEDNTAYTGGAISAPGGFPEVIGCKFGGNSADVGGAISIFNGGGVVNSCAFSGNTASYWGGAVVLNWSTATARYNTFEGNSSPIGQGGALACVYGTTLTMHGSSFAGNSATAGGALFMRDADVFVFTTEFEENRASEGGAVFLMNPYDSTPAFLDLEQCSFTGNGASVSGGAIRVAYGASMQVSRTDFYANSAEDLGGAIHFGSKNELFVANARFGMNSADLGGAVMHDGDHYYVDSADATYVNCTFIGNVAVRGSAQYNDLAATRSANCSYTLNRASGSGTLAQTTNGACRVTNAIVWDNQGGAFTGSGFTVVYSDVQGGYAGTGNINANPLFADSDGADNVAGTPDDDPRLLAASPCLDAGSNAGLPADATDLDLDLNLTEATPLDLDLGARVVNGVVDMGAYERP